MNPQKNNQFRKKFQRRTTILAALCYATFLSAVEDGMNFSKDNMNGLDLSPQGISICRPFAPHITVLSSAEIQVSWLPATTSNGVDVGRYELYQGDELEYSGHDLEHIAKRLKPSTEYDFKVRACGALPGTCSEFSIARYAKTDSKPRIGEGTALTSSYLGKRRIFYNVLPGLVFSVLVIGLCFAMIYLYRRISSYFSEGSEEDMILFGPSASQATPLTDSLLDKKARASSCHLLLPSSESEEVKDVTKISKDVEAGNYGSPKDETDGVKAEKMLQIEEAEMEVLLGRHLKEHDAQGGERRRSPPTRRKRTRSIRKHRTRDYDNQVVTTSEECVDEILARNLAEKVCRTSPDSEQGSECVVLVDNSNIFIGARETACAENPKLRPKHVKMRLHGLVSVLEKGRNVTKAFAGCSSPPASDHIWEVYRRLGYTVDLEDRRGKDEQRVDELLHLEIYQALFELTPRTLVLATGDGNKGKSKSGSSFVSCVSAAMDRGWQVELHSWQHCLSSEWLKVAKKYEEQLRICYLDEHLHDIVHIDR